MTLDWRRRRRKLVMAPYAIYSHVELSARNLITSITHRSTKNRRAWEQNDRRRIRNRHYSDAVHLLSSVSVSLKVSIHHQLLSERYDGPRVQNGWLNSNIIYGNLCDFQSHFFQPRAIQSGWPSYHLLLSSSNRGGGIQEQGKAASKLWTWSKEVSRAFRLSFVRWPMRLKETS